MASRKLRNKPNRKLLGKEDADHGTFSDEPQTKWITESEEDRDMVLIKEFSFTDPAKKRWEAGNGYRTDGASIPRELWALIGSPFTGNYRRAAIVHDKACDDAGGNQDDRLAADIMFYHACRAGGCSWYEATLLFIGVRIGAYLPLVYEWKTPNKQSGPRLYFAEDEERLQRDFRRISERVIRQGETDNPKIIHQRTEEALREVVTVKM